MAGSLKAVFFDLDGTLLDEDLSVEKGIDAFHGAHREALGRIDRPEFGTLWRSVTEKHMKRFLRREIGFQDQRRERMRELFRAPGLTDAEADSRIGTFLRAYEESWRLYDDVLACLRGLVPLALGIITNGDPVQQAEKLARLGLTNLFPVVVAAGAVGMAKPAPEIFREACSRIGHPLEACAYVGDHFEVDAQGSQRAGMVAVWLDRLGRPKAPAPIITIQTLAGLLPALS